MSFNRSMTVFKINNGVPFGRSCTVMEVYFLQNLSEKGSICSECQECTASQPLNDQGNICMIALSVKRCSKREHYQWTVLRMFPTHYQTRNISKFPLLQRKTMKTFSKDGAITVQYACTLHHQNAVKTSTLNISFLPLRTFEKRIA